jgi:hypothetical protein
MNYSGDDYIMGHIVRAAWATGAKDFRVDLFSGSVSESLLVTEVVALSIQRYVRCFPDLVSSSQSSISFIAAAEMIVLVDPTTRRPAPVLLQYAASRTYFESPFTCTVRLEDDKGKVYSHTISDWWYPENQ